MSDATSFVPEIINRLSAILNQMVKSGRLTATVANPVHHQIVNQGGAQDLSSALMMRHGPQIASDIFEGAIKEYVSEVANNLVRQSQYGRYPQQQQYGGYQQQYGGYQQQYGGYPQQQQYGGYPQQQPPMGFQQAMANMPGVPNMTPPRPPVRVDNINPAFSSDIKEGLESAPVVNEKPAGPKYVHPRADRTPTVTIDNDQFTIERSGLMTANDQELFYYNIRKLPMAFDTSLDVVNYVKDSRCVKGQYVALVRFNQYLTFNEFSNELVDIENECITTKRTLGPVIEKIKNKLASLRSDSAMQLISVVKAILDKECAGVKEHIETLFAMEVNKHIRYKSFQFPETSEGTPKAIVRSLRDIQHLIDQTNPSQHNDKIKTLSSRYGISLTSKVNTVVANAISDTMTTLEICTNDMDKLRAVGNYTHPDTRTSLWQMYFDDGKETVIKYIDDRAIVYTLPRCLLMTNLAVTEADAGCLFDTFEWVNEKSIIIPEGQAPLSDLDWAVLANTSETSPMYVITGMDRYQPEMFIVNHLVDSASKHVTRLIYN